MTTYPLYQVQLTGSCFDAPSLFKFGFHFAQEQLELLKE